MLCTFLSRGLSPPRLRLFLRTFVFSLLYQRGFAPGFHFWYFILGVQEIPLVSQYWLCVPLLRQSHLLREVVSWRSLWDFSMHSTMSSANNDSFPPCFQFGWHLFLFLARSLWLGLPVLCSGDSGRACLVLHLRGKGFRFSPLSVMLAVGLRCVLWPFLRE